MEFLMRDYPFSYEQLFNFSKSHPYTNLGDKKELFEQLEFSRKKLNFPAIENDIGSLFNFIFKLKDIRTVFEMGSGYGHSAFWYLFNSSNLPERIILTEKRDDLYTIFNSLPWPESWKSRLDYFQGDAFEKLKSLDHQIDFALIDGVKGDYLRFLKEAYPKLSRGGIVAIDNSYWRGSFLDPELVIKKQSARNIAELHAYLTNSSAWEGVFIPFRDGLSLLRKK